MAADNPYCDQTYTDCGCVGAGCVGSGGGGDDCSVGCASCLDDGTPAGAKYFCDYSTCQCEWGSPIIVDTKGSGFQLTSANDGVIFDIMGNGHPIKLAWTAAGSGNAFLALDRNHNGRIDSGKEPGQVNSTGKGAGCMQPKVPGLPTITSWTEACEEQPVCGGLLQATVSVSKVTQVLSWLAAITAENVRNIRKMTYVFTAMPPADKRQIPFVK